jgi:hypothetical protein
MSSLSRHTAAILFGVAGALFFIGAFLPPGEPTNYFLMVIGVINLLLAFGAYRRANARAHEP